MFITPAREIVRAVDRLTTQARRLIDHLTTPVTDQRTTGSAVPRQPVAARAGHHSHGESHHPISHDDDGLLRDALLTLSSRAARGVLTPAQGQRLQQDVEQLLIGHDRSIEEAHRRADVVETERDGAYRERAQLLAWLATTHPAVLAPAPDVDEPGWQILYLNAPCGQLSWHIAPRDTALFTHVELVPADDPRAQWDGHTTDEKYERIRGAIGTAAAHPTAGAPTA
nr:hypothetical protein [Streptomyces monomycini]